jgi:hypothetical protein
MGGIDWARRIELTTSRPTSRPRRASDPKVRRTTLLPQWAASHPITYRVRGTCTFTSDRSNLDCRTYRERDLRMQICPFSFLRSENTLYFGIPVTLTDCVCCGRELTSTFAHETYARRASHVMQCSWHPWQHLVHQHAGSWGWAYEYYKGRKRWWQRPEVCARLGQHL